MESKSSLQFALVRFLHRYQIRINERRYIDKNIQWTIDTYKIYGSIKSALIKENHVVLYNLINKHLIAIIKKLYRSPITAFCVSKLIMPETSYDNIKVVEYFVYSLEGCIKCSCKKYRRRRNTNTHIKYANYLLSFMPKKFIEDFKNSF